MHLDLNDIQAIAEWLEQHRLLAPAEVIQSAEKAGEGNMNYTLRIRSNQRSFILKQARPYVEKYPSIAAPVERAAMEADFFKVGSLWTGVKEFLPRLIYFSPEDHLQVLEDLGEGADFTVFYSRKAEFPTGELATLLQFLHQLHQTSRTCLSPRSFSNRAMRELNHFHIFDFPFQENNGLNLDEIQPGLQALAARSIFQTQRLREKTLALGQLYLADGDALLHGDFFPGSWLRTERGVFVIDPEFCFRGDPAFDLGVVMAHLCFCGISWNEASSSIQLHYQGDYAKKMGLDFAAVEILRRFFGVAQLPLSFSIAEKESLTNIAIRQLLG
jgi:5-methylthioribose kinase